MRIGFLFLFLAYVAWTQTFNFEQWETKSHLIQSIFIKSDLSSVMNKNFLLKIETVILHDPMASHFVSKEYALC